MRCWVFGFFLLLAGCGDDPEINVCDAQIRSTLKAPSSYKRVGVSKQGGAWRIDYDAVNSFNAPLRGHGTCTVYGNQAIWFEDRMPGD
jgi:hypothetical protein